MGLICRNRVDREEIAAIETPARTETWHPVPHMDVISAVEDEIRARSWDILEEDFGIARSGQRMFGVLRVAKGATAEWQRCIGIRNSHDQSLAVGLAAGIRVMVCENLAFGGTIALRRRHTSRIDLDMIVSDAITALEGEFDKLTLATENLKRQPLLPDEARSCLVKAAECRAINSCDIVPIFREYQHPRHEEFAQPTRWSFLNAFTEHAKKYSPGRADVFHSKMARLFGLDGNPAALWG